MDKNTIGLTDANDQLVTRLVEAGLFNQDMDAAKYAIGLAMSQGIAPAESPGIGTKWNVGSFDRDGQLRTVLELLYPDVAEPYRVIEHFANVGLERIAKEWADRRDLNARVLCAICTEVPAQQSNSEK